MLRFHCALKAEAAPINAFFGLSLQKRTNTYSLFAKDNMQMLVTGSGAHKIQLALNDFKPNACSAIWLNIGIAGSAEFSHGSVVPVAAVKYLYHKPVAINCDQKGVTVLTLNKPSLIYPEKVLLDMELWHLKQFIGNDLLYSLKIVSDVPNSGFVSSKKQIKDLIRQAMPQINKMVSKNDLNY